MFQRTVPVLAILFTVTLFQNARGQAASPTNPIMFVTQVPVPQDFTTVGSVFGNHLPDPTAAVRGGDLWIRYPDGTLKNLTAAAGFGSVGQMQDAKSIAVREPSIHWSGTKALFGMVIGVATKQFDNSYSGFWQIYEITGFGQGQTPVITKVPNQPAAFNNVSPLYGTDERVLFTSDRPRNGAAYLYPQRDEYEFAPTTTGIWSLDPVGGGLFLMSHDPSGSFSPTIDSFGRVIFTRWDHLQRDQEADTDALSKKGTIYGTMNFADESANAAQLPRQEELFPEPRGSRSDLLQGTNLVGHAFNQFFPWMINENGSAEETLNHVGRHELFDYMSLSLNDDPNLQYFSPSATRVNKNRIDNFLEIREDPTHPGLYYGIDAPEFQTHAAGQIVTLTGPAGIDPDNMFVTYITPRATQTFNVDGAPADPASTGHYRNPLPLSDGILLAVHSPETRADKNDGTAAAPTTRYDFRIKTMTAAGSSFAAGAPLMASFTKTISYWTPDVLATYSGSLWELNPVEVVARAKPVKPDDPIQAPEQSIFTEENVDVSGLKTYLAQNNLALIISRNLTTRDRADKQQPFNLRVTGTTTQDIPAPGKVYDISHLQLFQADQLRGFTGGGQAVRPGRRVLATPMHDGIGQNPADPGGPPGSVQIGVDGSMAAFVPANRAMTWQTTAADGTPVVRERYWLSFQPGEIRTCTSCHGINTADQSNQAVPQNKPEALRTLLKYWKSGIANNPPPVMSSAPTAAPNPAQVGQSVTFAAMGTGIGGLTYSWSFGDGSPSQQGASVSHTFSTAGVYGVTVVVADGGGKTTAASLQVTVNAAPPGGPTITTVPTAAPNPAQTGQTVGFSVLAMGAAPLSYSWNFGDATATQTGATVRHVFTQAGAFNAAVTVTDVNGKSGGASLLVAVSATPPPPPPPPPPVDNPPVITAAPSALPNPALSGQAVAFSVTATGAGTLAYTWDFGDFTSAQGGANISHAYQKAGTYAVTLTVTDGNGKSTQGSVQVSVHLPLGELTAHRALLHFDFKNAADDSLSLTGTLQLPADFNPDNQTGQITLGTFSTSATLNSTRGNTVIMLRRVSRKGTGAVPWNATISLKNQALFGPLSALGFSSGNVAPAVNVVLPVTLTVNGIAFQTNVTLQYSARSGRFGTGMKR